MHRAYVASLLMTMVLVRLQFVTYETRSRIVILVEEGTWSHKSETQNLSGHWRSDEQVRTSVQVRADVWNQVTIDI